MIRVAVTGRNGQAARALAEVAQSLPDLALIVLARPEFDLERPEGLAAALCAAAPDLVVNAAAYTAVDRAEADEARAFAVNRDGAAALAAAASALGIPLVHLSTDYVFGGGGPGPHGEAGVPSPLNAYGRSKRAGEVAVLAAHPNALVLRVSWLFSPFGQNFVRTMLRLAGEGRPLHVVDDQLGTPTSALDVARALLALAPRLARERHSGILHLANAGSATWCGLASRIMAESAARGGPSVPVTAIATADYPLPARRPADSRLDAATVERRFGLALRPWEEAVAETVERLLAATPGLREHPASL